MPLDPRALSSLQAGGFDQNQVFAQGGIPINALRTMELQAAQAGDADRLARIRTIMDIRRQEMEPQLLSARPEGNFNDNIDRRSFLERGVDSVSPFRVLDTQVFGQ